MKALLIAGLFALATFGAVRRPADVPARAVASVDTVDLTPALDTLLIRTTSTFTARVVDSVGRRKNTAVTFTLRDTSAMQTRNQKRDSLGFHSVQIRAKADTGRSYLVAQSGTKKDSSLIVVRDTICDPETVASINLYPDSTTSHRTDSLGIVALPREQCGGVLVKNLTWSSSDSTKATVTRLDSLVARIQVLDSGTGTVYVKGVSGTKRDSVKVKLKHAP